MRDQPPLGLVNGSWFSDHFWWGSNVAEWVGAIGTVLALGAAGFALWHEMKQARQGREQTAQSLALAEASLRAQQARDKLDQDERRAAQAALVACRANYDASLDPAIHVLVHNLSRMPIFEVRTFYVLSDGYIFRGTPQVMEPARGPHGTKAMTGPFNKALRAEHFCGITFRDNSGNWWIKWGRGQLEPMTDDLPAQLSAVYLDGRVHDHTD